MIYDVAIIGAGLAGLTLSRQLSLEVPSAKVCLIHDKAFPNPLAAHKVGESTVEIGGFYLRDTLALNDYMHKTHLVKMGLRFLQTNNNEEGYKELGVYHFPYHDAFQIDRGMFENDLYNILKENIDIYEKCRFIDFERIDGIYNIKTLQSDGVETIVKTRWLIDASGRKRCLARKFGFETRFPLTHSAVWFRVDGIIDLNNIYVSDDPENVFKDKQRRNSTVHLMGKGRWVWLIPLAENKTSIGIVFDEKIIRAEDLVSQEKAFLWLKNNENKLYNELEINNYPILDFKFFRKYSYLSDEFISSDKWAVVGEAKAFIDPLYSNGTDVIAIENTMLCNIIDKDMKGEKLCECFMREYNDLINEILKIFISVHENSYKFFDDWYYINLKTNMDAILYFGTFCVMFMNKKMKDYEFLRSVKPFILEAASDHKRLMDYIKSPQFQSDEKPVKRFIPIEESIESYINRHIVCENNDDISVLDLLRDNVIIYKKMVDYILSGRDFEDIFYPPSEPYTLDMPVSENFKWRYGNFFKS